MNGVGAGRVGWEDGWVTDGERVDRTQWPNAGWCDRCETEVYDLGVHNGWHANQDSGEPPPTFSGSGAAAPMAANMAARLMAGGASAQDVAKAVRERSGEKGQT